MGAVISSNRSLKPSNLKCGTSMDQPCLSSSSSGLYWVEILGSKSAPQTHCCVPQTIPESFLLCGRVHYPAEGNTVSMRVYMVCNNTQVGGTYQSNINTEDSIVYYGHQGGIAMVS